MELDATGAVTATHTFGANGLTSRHTTSSTFYTFDVQGGVAQRLDASQSVLSSHQFTAHGSEVTTASSDPFGYGAQWGYYTDRETGLQLLTHRYYDPNAGRFVTRDPISYAGGINLYGYVANSVVNDIDPAGLDGISNRRPTLVPPDPKDVGTRRRISDPPPSRGGFSPTPTPPPPSGPAAGGSSDCGCDIPRWPDYYSFQFSSVQMLGPIGGTISVSMDKYYHFYVGGGPIRAKLRA